MKYLESGSSSKNRKHATNKKVIDKVLIEGQAAQCNEATDLRQCTAMMNLAIVARIDKVLS